MTQTHDENAMKHTYPECMWAGTEHSLTLAREAHNAIMAGIYDQPEKEEPEAPYTFSQQGSVGVISIRGSLVNNDSIFNRYYGQTSYAEIRRAMIHAANESGVKAILLDIESGGGAVSGVADTADLIANINANVKPVYAFTDGIMASAAYWLGSAAGQVFTSKTAMMGSIGVISTHMEVSKMLKERGVGVTVMRAGEFKALVNQFEPLTKVAMEQMQGQLNAAYGVFVSHVAEARGTSVEVVDKVMAQGLEFMGGDAVTAGLADGVTTFDALMGKIEQNIIDKNAKSEQTPFSFQRGTEMKKALTAQDVAAIAAGGLAATVPDVAPAAPAVPAAEVVTPEPAAEIVPEATPVAAAPVAAAPAAPAADPAVVTMLQGQLREAQASVLALTIENTKHKDTIASMESTHTALMKIAGASLSNMKVALGFSAVDASVLKPEELLIEHTKTAEAFASRFKAGGVAAATTPDEQAPGPALNPRFAAILQANRYPTK